MDRILIVRTGSLGDIVHTLPAAATLRRAYPHAELDWVVERQWAPLLARNPHLTQVHELETRAWLRRPGSPATWRSLLAVVGNLRRRRYDCAADFQGLVKSAVVARLSGARKVVGFDDPWEPASALLYTLRVRPNSNGRQLHMVERNLAIAAALGASEPVLEFPFCPDEEAAARMRAVTGGRGRYAVIIPSAGWNAKCWPEEGYAALICRLARDLLLPSVINCGPGEERVGQGVAELAAEAQPILLQPSVAELMALVRDAALVVGGDTGPVHLAAACQTPVVAIFGPTDPLRNGPFGGRCRVVRSEQADTNYSRKANRQAISGVTVEAVFQAVTELLPPA